MSQSITRLLAAGTVTAAAAFALAAPASAAPDHRGDKQRTRVKVEKTVKVVSRDHDRGLKDHYRDHRSERRSHKQEHRSHRRDYRRDHRADRRHNTHRHYSYSRPYHNWKHRPYRSNYVSPVGISFVFGGHHNRHYWSPSKYYNYSSNYGPYIRYKNRTFCERVLVDGYHYRRRALISVKQCSNPWNGTYYIQGSERIVR